MKRLGIDLFNTFTRIYHAIILFKFLPTHSNTVPFIIVGKPRSGSTLLQTLIDSHPNAICMHELIKDNSSTPAFSRYYIGRRKKLLSERQDNIMKFINQIIVSEQPPWIKVVGFKALYTQPWDPRLRDKVWNTFASIQNLKVLWIERNPVASVVSFTIARNNNKWVGGETSPNTIVDINYILQRLNYEKSLLESLSKYINNFQVHKMHYEQLIANPNNELNKVQKYLNLPLVKLHTSLKKQNKKHLHSIISNYNELRKVLLKTEWAKSLLEIESKEAENEL